MRLEKIMAIAVVLAVLTAVAAGLSVLNARNSMVSPAWTMISRFIVVLVFGSFGLAVARESQLQGSLFINVEEWSLTVRDIVNYGVLPGFVLGLINYFFFFTYRYSPLVAARIRGMQSIYDSFIISLDSGMAEEIVYRLFILSCFLFSFRHLYSRIRSEEHTSELQSRLHLVCRLLLEKKKRQQHKLAVRKNKKTDAEHTQ